MASLKERKRALQDFMAGPKTMDAICNSLHLNSGSQVHKDLVRAIVQITAYGKKHVNNYGLIEPRKFRSDGTHSTTFSQDFQALVDRFMVKLRAGVIFFPVLLPHYDGWADSFWADDRLQWSSTLEREEIRGGILLMFENIKNNGVTIDLTDAEVYESFTTEDCDDCGSGHAPAGDDIVYCDICRLGHHQSCYDIYPKPEPEDSWNCKVCDASKQASASASKKRKFSSTPKKKTPKARNVRHKQEDSEYSDVYSPRSALDIPGTNSPLRQVAKHQEGGKRRLSLNVQQKGEQSQSGHRAVSQPVNIQPLTEPSKSRRALTQIPPLNTLINVPEEEGSTRVKAPRSASSVKVLSEISTPSPEPRLYHTQIDGTILLARLKDDKIYRKVPLTEARTVNSLFEVCAKRWAEKFGSGRISRLLYVDEENNLVEIAWGNSADYKELLRMIQRRWDTEGMKEVVQVKVILLAAEEEKEL